jgi:hypothetical protein
VAGSPSCRRLRRGQSEEGPCIGGRAGGDVGEGALRMPGNGGSDFGQEGRFIASTAGAAFGQGPRQQIGGIGFYQ